MDVPPQSLREQVLLKYLDNVEADKSAREIAAFKSDLRGLKQAVESLAEDVQSYRKEFLPLQQLPQGLASLEKTQMQHQADAERRNDEMTVLINQADQRLEDETKDHAAQLGELRASIEQLRQHVDKNREDWQRWKQLEAQGTNLRVQQTATDNGLGSSQPLTPEMLQFVNELMDMRGPLATVLAAAKTGREIYPDQPMVETDSPPPAFDTLVLPRPQAHPETGPPPLPSPEQQDSPAAPIPYHGLPGTTIHNAVPICPASDTSSDESCASRRIKNRQKGPRSVAFFAHLKQAKHRHASRPPASKRAFVWTFINKIEFEDWRLFIEEQLLLRFPQYVSKNRRKDRQHLISIEEGLTFEDVYSMIKRLKIPHHLEG